MTQEATVKSPIKANKHCPNNALHTNHNTFHTNHNENEHGVFGFLDDRQRLIVQIIKLSSAVDARHHDIVEALNIRFCQQIIDYLSNGHFQIYSDLFPTDSAIISQPEYLDLDATTQIGMRYHDHYTTLHGRKKINLDILKTCLEELILAFETRFELEDFLINQYQAETLSA